MFNKSNPPKGPQPPMTLAPEAPPAPAPLPAPAPKARTAPTPTASALRAGLAFEGAISGDADLVIEGMMKGDVDVVRLTIGESAAIEGRIRAHHVDVHGRVIGDIEAQSVRLAETAHVEGDILHGQISIEAGAHFQGNCRQINRAEATPSTGAEVVDLDSARA